jgi:hypothetical protein
MDVMQQLAIPESDSYFGRSEEESEHNVDRSIGTRRRTRTEGKVEIATRVDERGKTEGTAEELARVGSQDGRVTHRCTTADEIKRELDCAGTFPIYLFTGDC